MLWIGKFAYSSCNWWICRLLPAHLPSFDTPPPPSEAVPTWGSVAVVCFLPPQVHLAPPWLEGGGALASHHYHGGRSYPCQKQPCRQGATISSVCSPPLHPLPPALGTAGLAHCTEGSTPDCLTVQVGYAVAKIKIWAHIVIWKRHEVLLKIRIKLPQCSRARNGIWIPGWHHWFFH